MDLKHFCNLKCLKIIKKIDFCSLSKTDGLIIGIATRLKRVNREIDPFYIEVV